MRILIAMALVCVASCASEKLARAPPAGVDLTGHWKLNEADSDDPQRLMLAQNAAASQSSAPGGSGGGSGGSRGGRGGGRGGGGAMGGGGGPGGAGAARVPWGWAAARRCLRRAPWPRACVGRASSSKSSKSPVWSHSPPTAV